MRCSDSGHSRFMASARWARRLARGIGTVVAAIAVGSLLAPAVGDAAPAARAVRGGHVTLAQLEAKAARLSRLYRGQLLTLAGAEAEAKAATARAREISHLLDQARGQIARLAVASYVDGGPEQVLAVLFSGDPQQVLSRSAIVMYLSRERGLRERTLQRLAAVNAGAQAAASAKIARLASQIAALEHRRHVIERMLARFHPQSPVVGPHITPRMLAVRNAIDARFGPFPSIGCWRPGTSGEHPLGRACDFMLSTGGVMPSPPWIRKGYAVAQWAQKNAARLGIMYIIYRQRIWDIRMASAGWVLMPDRGGITANHYDHVHISVF